MAQDSIFIGGGGPEYRTAQHLLLKYGNRHGLIAGATGTGKTITMQVMAEAFSNAGVPVFLEGNVFPPGWMHGGTRSCNGRAAMLL